MTERGNTRIQWVFCGMACKFARAIILLAAAAGTSGATYQFPLSLRETLTPSPLVEKIEGNVIIAGHIDVQSCSNVLIRVTTSHGLASQAGVAVISKCFRCRYPADFADASPEDRWQWSCESPLPWRFSFACTTVRPGGM